MQLLTRNGSSGARELPHFEHVLITRIVETTDIRTAIKRKVTEDYFVLPDTRSAYSYLIGYYNEYGTTPSVDLFKEKFPDFDFHTTSDPVAAVCDYLRQNKLYRDLVEMVEEGVVLTRESPATALDHFRRMVASLTTQHVLTRDMDITKTVQEIKAEYDRVAEGHGMLGCPWPWPKMNETTLGMQNGELVFWYARPKAGKCVVEGERVMGPDGSMTPIENLPSFLTVPSYTEATGKIRWATAERVVMGEKDCVAVTLKSGLRLRSSNEHLYMTPFGYRRICDLRPGDYVATALKLPTWTPGPSALQVPDAYFLGVLIGDGNFTRNEVQFTTADHEIREAVGVAATRFGAEVVMGSRSIEYRITGPERSYEERRGGNPVLNWLRELGIAPGSAHTKHIPYAIWTSSAQSLAAFLAGLLDTDGGIESKCVSWSSVSETLARDIQNAFLRFGIKAKLRSKITNFGTVAWIVSVYSTEQHRLLAEYVAPHLQLTRKRDALLTLSERQGVEKRNVDSIPYTDELFQLILREKGNKPWPRLNDTRTGYFSVGKLFRRTNRISRSLLRWLANEWESVELLKIADSDLQWEQIESIESIGRKQCYDVCIRDGQDPNYVAEGFIIHNTWLMVSTAVHAFKHGRRVLFITMEMPTEQIRRRAAAVWSKTNYQALRSGQLTVSERQRYFDDLDALSELDGFILSGGDENRGTGITALGAKIQEYNPDIVFVDGVYLMHDDRGGKRSSDWQAISHITQDLKSLGKRANLPIVGSTQSNRQGEKTKGASLSEMAFSDSFVQDGDYVIRLIHGQKEKDDREAIVTLPGIREAPGCTFTINALFAEDLSQKHVAETQEEIDEFLAGTDDAAVVR